MSTLGPSRRARPSRRRNDKPYAKKAAVPPAEAAPKSTLSSLFSIFTNPFRRVTQPSPSGDTSDEDGSSTEGSGIEDLTAEVEGTLYSKDATLSRRADAPLGSFSSFASSSGQTSASNFGGASPPSPRIRSPFDHTSASSSAGPSAATGSPSDTSQGASAAAIGGQSKDRIPPRSPEYGEWQPPPKTFSGFGRNTPFSSSQHPPELRPSDAFDPNFVDTRPRLPLPPSNPYSDVLRFLNDKAMRSSGGVPLTEMEVLSLTEQLKKNATEGAREMLDSISLNVPSAALMAEYGRRAGGSPSRPNANDVSETRTYASPLRKPFLAPEPRPVDSPSSPAGTPGRRRRRNLYAGVGQSPARATSTPRARPSPAPGSRLKLERSFGEDTGSNKKRLVGHGGIPMSSGSGSFESTASSGAGRTSQSTSFTASFESSQGSSQTSSSTSVATSSVPFPSVSPVKSVLSSASASSGPFSRTPGLFPTARRGNTMPAPVPPIPRPEAPKHPSPLRRVNMADVSSSSESESQSGTPERTAVPKKPELSRSSASAAILDIVMDDANTLPPVKSRSKNDNPFDELMPAPRVSTPVRRPSQRFPSRKSAGESQTPAASTSINAAGSSRTTFSNSILDQIDNTAPKLQSNVDRVSTRSEPPQPFSNSFAPSSSNSSPFTHLMSSVSAFNSKTPDPTSSIFSNTQGDKLAKPNLSSSSSSTSKGFQSSSLLDRIGAGPPPPRFRDTLKKPEILVVDEDDEIVEIAATSRRKGSNRGLPEDEIMVEEVDEDELDDYEGGNGKGAEFIRSPSPDLMVPTFESHKKHIEHATSVEEADQVDRRGSLSPEKPSSSPTSPEKSSSSSSGHSRGSGRFGGSISIPNGVHAGPSFKTSSSPVIPSPLRQVSLPPDDDFKLDGGRRDDRLDTIDEDKPFGASKGSLFDRGPTSPKIPAPKFASFIAPTVPASASAVPRFTGGDDALRQQALATPTHVLPSFSLVSPIFSSSTTLEGSDARNRALAVSSADLPAFDLRGRTPSSSSSGQSKDFTTPEGSSITVATALIPPVALPPSVTQRSFDWAAAGLKPPSAPTTREWTCSTCSLKNKFDHEVCIICDARRPSGISSASSVSSSESTPISASGPGVPPGAKASVGGGFNWEAAGLKPPTAGTQSANWTCGTCMLSNPPTKSKCMVCDAPQPAVSNVSSTSASSTPASTTTLVPPPASGFNWTAAGLQPPSSDSQWTCGTCSLKNVASSSKCTVCDAAKPSATNGSASPLFGSGSSTPTSFAPATTTHPPDTVLGFDWAAAGLKLPSSGDWTCGLCMVSNPASKTKCLSCETPK